MREARWQDPISLAALEESKHMENNPKTYKCYKNAEELFNALNSDLNNEKPKKRPLSELRGF